MNRQAIAIAKTLTILGLMADIAYVNIHVAALFLLDGMWLESLVYAVAGASSIAFISTIGTRKVRAILTQEERR